MTCVVGRAVCLGYIKVNIIIIIIISYATAQISHVIPGDTEPNFTKFLHDLLSTPAALTTPRRFQSGCDGLSQFKKRKQANPLVPAREFNLIA